MTSNIDGIAKEGANFTDWYGRHSVLTGMVTKYRGTTEPRLLRALRAMRV